MPELKVWVFMLLHTDQSKWNVNINTLDFVPGFISSVRIIIFLVCSIHDNSVDTTVVYDSNSGVKCGSVQCWRLDYVSIISQKPIIVNTSSRQSTSNLMVETVNQTSPAHVVYQVYCHDHSCTYINYKSIIKVFWWEIIYVMWAGWLLCRGGRTCFLNSITNIHKLSLQIQIQPPPLSFSLISFSKQ